MEVSKPIEIKNKGVSAQLDKIPNGVKPL